jgi:hypothetical protein
MMSGRLLRLATAAALVLGAATLAARPMISEVRQVPVDRLAANLEALIAKDPTNVSVRLNLARLYAMAYALKTDTAPVRPDREADGVDFGFGNNGAVPFKNKPDASPAALREAQAQLTKALATYRETIALDPGNLVAGLGYAWCLSQTPDKAAAIRAYRRTIALAWDVEQKPRKAMYGDQSITEEAAAYLIPLLDPVADRDEIALSRERIALINKQTARWITPIAVPLRPGLTPDDLRNDGTAVRFDADGSGIAKPWTWISTDAGWLVADIHRSGRITSALQWFGNVTWWLFWNNGYEPLRALDDNADGTIAGRELEGLSVWRDANSNGISESGEVQPVAFWRIVALSYDHQIDPADRDEILFAPKGVTFADGSTRPTFDLILHRR